MTQIVYPNGRHARSGACLAPGMIVDACEPLVLVREHVLGMLPALRFNHASGDAVEHYDPFLTVLGHRFRKQEHGTIEFRHLDLPGPLQTSQFR